MIGPQIQIKENEERKTASLAEHVKEVLKKNQELRDRIDTVIKELESIKLEVE